MIKQKYRVLVLAPHTDDGEFGCGGTLAKFLQEGMEVYYVAFSSCEASLPRGAAKDTLIIELKNAANSLGIKKENLVIFDYPVRKFPSHRQAILEDLVKLNREIKPDIVFLPSTYDTHQDHNTISDEGFRAFKKCTILGYELPWNNLTFTTSSFMFLTEEHIQSKIKAIKCYKSQYGRQYSTEDSIRSHAVMRGTQIGFQFAESFEVIRLIMK